MFLFVLTGNKYDDDDDDSIEPRFETSSVVSLVDGHEFPVI